MTKQPELPNFVKPQPTKTMPQEDLIVMGFKPSTLAKLGAAAQQYSEFQVLSGGPIDIEIRSFAKQAREMTKGEGA